MSRAAVLKELVGAFASSLPTVDATAQHHRFQAGIGPFEEEEQVRMLRDEADSQGLLPGEVDLEVPYPNSSRACDLAIRDRGLTIPVEVKLLRFRRDNADEDPYRYRKVFSPFNANTLMTDAKKLSNSEFDATGGLLGLYYERENEPYGNLSATNVAEKFAADVGFWYDFDAEVVTVSDHVSLRHPVFERGAVVAWQLEE